MTLQEVKKLLTLTVANFPSLQEKDLRSTALLWQKMLGDIPYDVAEKALIMVLTKAKYFPTVAEIREAAAELQFGRPMAADEAWGLVLDAIRHYLSVSY